MTVNVFEIPADDPTWDICPEHSEKHWCDSTREWIVSGKDADEIEFGGRYCVPIIPGMNAYATVAISSDPIIPNLAAALSLVKVEPEGLVAAHEEFIPLGMWTKGEGRVVFTTILIDWAMGQTQNGTTACPLRTHGFAEEQRMKTLRADPANLVPIAWSLAYVGHCPPCQERLINNAIENQWTAADVGISQSSIYGPKSSSRSGFNRSSDRQKNTAAAMAEQMQGRFQMPGA